MPCVLRMAPLDVLRVSLFALEQCRGRRPRTEDRAQKGMRTHVLGDSEIGCHDVCLVGCTWLLLLLLTLLVLHYVEARTARLSPWRSASWWFAR